MVIYVRFRLTEQKTEQVTSGDKWLQLVTISKIKINIEAQK